MQVTTQDLNAALIGYTTKLQDINKRIVEIKNELRGDQKTIHVVKPRKPMSAAARKRIAAAQKKRWANYHKERAA